MTTVHVALAVAAGPLAASTLVAAAGLLTVAADRWRERRQRRRLLSGRPVDQDWLDDRFGDLIEQLDLYGHPEPERDLQ